VTAPVPYRADARNALQRAKREIVTPEGIPISFTLASVGDRAAALLIDLLILFGVMAVLVFLGTQALQASLSMDSWLLPFLIIALFLLQNFYFAFFEVRWQGATPGKRRLGLRVIDGRGGQLDASAVLARNLMRELELWLPLRFALAGSQLYPDAPSWARLAALAWIFVFVMFPFFNKERMRVGDLIAGTRVVVQPKPVLMADLADTTMSGHALFIPPAVATPPSVPEPSGLAGVYANAAIQAQAQAHTQGQGAAAPRPRQPTFAFTDAQLGVYGEYELQVLEGVLRDTGGIDREQTLAVVADKIQTKIGYAPRISYGQEERFLRDFYAAQRAHLEKRMLFGKRKADKFKK
jgi:uncharacterized RDD family membrane protein YckC